TLNWSTSNEMNNMGFVIEKSIDGNNWEKLGFIEGKGNSQVLQQYQFTDQKPFDGSNYYRLQQLDFDGSFEYSSIIQVSHSKASDIFFYPNPVTKHLNIHGLKEGTFVIYDSFGRCLKQGDFYTGVVDVSNLSSGILNVKLISKRRIWTKRIIKD
ncbi:MAG: T9SS type A sorting domain-containing protein, partial [Saprospiraceae bacterium]